MDKNTFEMLLNYVFQLYYALASRDKRKSHRIWKRNILKQNPVNSKASHRHIVTVHILLEKNQYSLHKSTITLLLFEKTLSNIWKLYDENYNPYSWGTKHNEYFSINTQWTPESSNKISNEILTSSPFSFYVKYYSKQYQY